MIVSQLKALIWLRWRLMLNFAVRQGKLSVVLTILIRIVIAVTAVVALLIGFLVGVTYLPDQPPDAALMLWGITVAAYLVFILLGVIMELQRADTLSLHKLLHLPMMPRGAFLINYTGSCLNMRELAFLNWMIGLSLGLLSDSGALNLFIIPLLIIAFFMMLTALIYQFRGWLATMTTNPRRRQTFMAISLMLFILLGILPGLPGMMVANRNKASTDNSVTSTSIDASKTRKDTGGKRGGQRRKPLAPGDRFKLQTHTRFVSAVLPPGWVVYGIVNTLEERMLPASLCLLGMTLIGVWSLRRSYHTTLKLYHGTYDSVTGRKQDSRTERRGSRPGNTAIKNHPLTAIRLPGIPAQAYAVGAAGFRSLWRLPEMKLTLFSPLLMLVVFGGVFASRAEPVTEYQAVSRAVGVTAIMLFISVLYILTNQFAYDRSGFRALVLSPTPRREVLLGKNLAVFPFAAGLMLVAIGACQWLAPMRADHAAAVVIEIFPAYLMYCLIGNAMSIYLPLIVKPGSAMPASGQGLKLFLRFLATVLSLALFGLLTLPLAIEYLMHLVAWGEGFPVFLLLALVQTGLMLWLYWVMLDKLAERLFYREQCILDVVTTRAE